MKLLTRIRLVNWHLFENISINCNGTTYFIGINGVGKSTILDAVQFALVGGQRDVKFNQAALSGGKRTLASYVRGELGTEGQRFLRGDATSVVALEFKNPDGTYFAHGAVIDAFEDGRAPDVAYFIVHNAQLNDSWFFKAQGQLFDTRAFKRHLEHFSLPANAGVRVFTKIEDYRVHLLNRLGQLKDTFPAKIVKGLAFSPLTDIRSFVHNYLLDENLVDVKTLQAQLETMRHFETLAIGVRERIDSLNAIEELNKERVANRRKRISNTAIARLAEADTFLDQLKQLRLNLDSFKLEFSREELHRDEIARALKLAQSALTDAEIALRTDQSAIREKELGEKIATLNAELTLLREKKKQADESLNRELSDAKKLRAYLTADNLPIPAELDSFVHAPLTTSHALLPTLQSLSNNFSREEILLSQKVTELRDEGSKLEDEIRKLRTGDRDTSYETESPHAARLRHLLRAELNLGTDEVKYLCDELSIPDESWQDAVEGLLGFNRFTLLVPPEQYNAAMKIYRKHKDSIHGATLLDTEAILNHKTEHTTRPMPHVPRNTLSSEISTSNPAARAYVDLLLGNHVKCEKIEDLREHRTAITRDCFVRRNFTDSHLNPNIYRRWFIGERAAPRQIEHRQARLDEIAGEMVSLNERTSALRERLALTRDKMRPFVELEHALAALAILPERNTEHATLTKELAKLDLRSTETLKAEVEKRQKGLSQVQDEANDSSRKLGNLEAEIRKLEAESILSVERSAEEKLKEQENFLASENADEETKSDIRK
ncbi:MAG: ATP-binding protein, partial [Chloroflexota bacterium]